MTRSLFIIISVLCLIWAGCGGGAKDLSKAPIEMPTTDTLPLSDHPLPLPAIDYYDPEHMIYSDRVYSQNIRTVQLLGSNFRAMPMLFLNRDVRLTFSFDDLAGGVQNYMYTLVHFNALWEPTDLDPIEYLDGFDEARISNYRFSTNTLQKYTHYSLELPNTDMRPSLSGNYLLKVYLEEEPDKVLITQRLLVIDPKATVSGLVKRSDKLGLSKTHQQLYFKVDISGIRSTNPIEEIFIYVLQNQRWDIAVKGVAPKFIHNNLMDFEFVEDLTFEAGKEFRFFDIRSFYFRSERVKDYVTRFDTTHALLYPDEVRSYKKYFYRSDWNGHFHIEIQELKNNELQADYAMVHFRLPFDSPLTLGDLYLYGKFSSWDATRRFQMKYNYEQRQYQARLYLKQGYYYYNYVFLEDGSQLFDHSLIEGNYFETENDYQVLVYFRPSSGRYDQLLGFQAFNSMNP